MHKFLFISSLVLLFNISSFSQMRPNWILNPPLPPRGNNTYYYKVESGEDIDIEGARISAIAKALYEGILKIGLFVNIDEIKDAIKKKGIPGASIDFKLPINIVCDYYESLITKRGYKVWLLCQIAESGNVSPRFENFIDCNPTELNTSFNAMVRSIFVPGWGQLYKGETFKGVSFMVSSLGCVAGGFIFNQLSLDANNKANSSRTQTSIDFYNQQKKDYDTYGKISFITAAAFYVWNLIDAIAVKQNNLYVGINTNKNLQICCSYNF